MNRQIPLCSGVWYLLSLTKNIFTKNEQPLDVLSILLHISKIQILYRKYLSHLQHIWYIFQHWALKERRPIPQFPFAVFREWLPKNACRRIAKAPNPKLNSVGVKDAQNMQSRNWNFLDLKTFECLNVLTFFFHLIKLDFFKRRRNLGTYFCELV